MRIAASGEKLKMVGEERPAKRIKIDSSATNSSTNAPSKTRANTNDPTHIARLTHESQQEVQGLQRLLSKNRKNGGKSHNTAKKKNGRGAMRTFSQPSVMCVGDKGIFVTSDKGCEKKALLELHDVLQDYFESEGIDASGDSTSLKSSEAGGSADKAARDDEDTQVGIEADIASELAELRRTGQADAEASDIRGSKPMQLITLDIPCVSFLRLPSKSSVDPVEVVHRLCLEASKPGSTQRSRFVKRLTPISSLAKTLRQGLETVSEEVLPHYFGPDEKGNVKSVKFAIRPTVRENEQLDRDLIIKPVANRIQDLGEAAHKVDLKHYEKGVIVEVYRGWIGMCVVDNTDKNGHQQGYEQLRRFNLSEIYAKR